MQEYINVPNLIGAFGVFLTIFSVWGTKLAKKLDHAAKCFAKFRYEDSPKANCEGNIKLLTIAFAIPLYVFFNYLYYLFASFVVKFAGFEAKTETVSYMFYNFIIDIWNIGLAIWNGSIIAILLSGLPIIIPALISYYLFIPIVSLFSKVLRFTGKKSFLGGLGIIITVVGFILGITNSA